VVVIDEQLESLAEQVSGIGEGEGPDDRPDQIESENRSQGMPDERAQTVSRFGTVIETEGQNQPVLVLVQVLVDLLRALPP